MFRENAPGNISSIVYVEGLHGLGDNIFQRPFVKDLATRIKMVWVRTPWPQIYWDIPNVQFVHCPSGLRTQAKNLGLIQGKIPYVLRSAAEGCAHARVNFFYHFDHLAVGSITDAFRKQCPPAGKLDFDLPKFAGPPIKKPYIVVRPATIRSEWKNPARNPDPTYIAQAAEQLRKHFTIVSVADLETNVEWIEGEEPYADHKFHGGELDVTYLLGLIRHAAGCVGGIGWLLPAAVAYHVPLLAILGGMGGHNAPAKVTDKDQDLSRVVWAKPDNFCKNCVDFNHPCAKFIGNFRGRLNEFEDVVCRAIAE